MSLLPYLCDDYTHDYIPPEFRTLPNIYYRPWRIQALERGGGTTVSYDKDKFQVNLDVQHFKPEEITVKAAGDNTITVEAKHEEKQDEHGHISRQFTRKYILPKGHDIQKVESKLSSDGVLTITAPKVNHNAIEGHREIPILQTGTPVKAIRANSTVSTKDDTKKN